MILKVPKGKVGEKKTNWGRTEKRLMDPKLGINILLCHLNLPGFISPCYNWLTLLAYLEYLAEDMNIDFTGTDEAQIM